MLNISLARSALLDMIFRVFLLFIVYVSVCLVVSRLCCVVHMCNNSRRGFEGSLGRGPFDVGHKSYL